MKIFDHLDPDIEDEVLSSLGIDNFTSVKFFARLQMRDKVIHSLTYKRVTRRNSFTVAYMEGPCIKYGQVKVFFQAPDESRILFGAVILPMKVNSREQLCEQHEFLGKLDGHIVPLNQPKRSSCAVVSLDDIIDVCVFIKFSDSNVCYVTNFPNRFDKD